MLISDVIPNREAFDNTWYLRAYPDVKNADMDAWSHYIAHGLVEGRLPKELRARAFEVHIWRGFIGFALPALINTLEDPVSESCERTYAQWALAKWYASQNKWDDSYHLLQQFLANRFRVPGGSGPVLLAIECAIRTARFAQATSLLSQFESRFPYTPVLRLLASNLHNALASVCRTPLESDQEKFEAINEVFRRENLALLRPLPYGVETCFDRLSSTTDHTLSGSSVKPLVSVIVPMFNAELTIVTCARSLLSQSVTTIELLFVDDASTDNTVQRLCEFLGSTTLRKGQSVEVLSLNENRGAYGARNIGVELARGQLITVHDSDDWSHPQKIEKQCMRLLQDDSVKATVSYWARCSGNLHFCSVPEPGTWIELNVSSLMVRREVVEEIGYWDAVRAGADSEYLERVIACYGQSAVAGVLEGIPLAFGRVREGSLTSSTRTHAVTIFEGVRKHYVDAYRRWHASSKSSADLYLPSNPVRRPFLAPSELVLQTEACSFRSVPDAIQQSIFWDPEWYATMYPDLRTYAGDLLEHFMDHGSFEDRDPSPSFSSSGYKLRYGHLMAETETALGHFFRVGSSVGYDPCPTISGHQKRDIEKPSVLLCGHQCLAEVYGAERALEDIALTLAELGWNVSVVLPAAKNAGYVENLRRVCVSVTIMPYGWWVNGAPASGVTISRFVRLIVDHAIDVVHVNTLVLEVPLLAAHACGVPVIVHAHELPTSNSELLGKFKSEPLALATRTPLLADLVIANSEVVQRRLINLQSKQREVPVVLVRNTVHMEELITLPGPGTHPTLCVGLVGYPHENKGADDAIVLGRILDEFNLSGESFRPVEIRIFGGVSPWVERFYLDQQQGLIPSNVRFMGYVPKPSEAFAQIDVVLNLSHVEESFGRTILEGMAAGLPVVAYRRGALPELVIHNHTGFLVEFMDVESVARYVLKLAADPELARRLGRAGRLRALETFGSVRFNSALRAAYDSLKSAFQ